MEPLGTSVAHGGAMGVVMLVCAALYKLLELYMKRRDGRREPEPKAPHCGLNGSSALLLEHTRETAEALRDAVTTLQLIHQSQAHLITRVDSLHEKVGASRPGH